jgi:hypothetical protein
MTKTEQKYFLQELEAIEKRIERIRDGKEEVSVETNEELEKRMEVIDYEPIDYCADCLLGDCLKH